MELLTSGRVVNILLASGSGVFGSFPGSVNLIIDKGSPLLRQFLAELVSPMRNDPGRSRNLKSFGVKYRKNKDFSNLKLVEKS